jgi:hypothetical protein
MPFVKSYFCPKYGWIMNKESDQFVSEMNAWHGRTIGQKTVEALCRNHFDSIYFETGKEAVEVIMRFISNGNTVAFGGSQTVRQLGLPDMIVGAGAVVLDHNAEGLKMDEKLEIMRRQQVCDVFICSSNAISMDGALYNVDGNGNRISAMIFGPRKVIVIAGTNKICPDESTAWQRIKTVAAPINMQRLNRPNPCRCQGVCMDCSLLTRGCNAYLVLRKKPSMSDLSVYIINEDLGF